MSSSSSLGGGFSFDTPEAVLQILASVRASDIAASEKNNLRDLILSYTNGGKDPSLKIQIEQTLTSSGITPVAAPPKATTPTTSAPQHDFGASRGVPTFDHTAQVKTNKPAPAPAAPKATPVQPAPAPTKAPTAPAAPAPSNIPVAPAAPQPPVTPKPAPAAAPTQPVPETPAVDSGDALKRIREIKTLVNDKIGNPVNLVDIDNEVGREYMAALLDAMKKLNSGSGSGPAMQRLEAAYVSVEKVLEKPRAEQPPAAPTPTPKPAVAPVASTPKPTPTPEPAPQPTVQPKPQAAPAVPAPKPAPAAAPTQPAPETPVAPKPAPEATRVPIQQVPVASPAAPKPAPAPAPVAPAPKPQPAPKPAQQPVDDARWSNPPSFGDKKPAAATPPAPASAPIQPLSQSHEPLKSVTDLPARDSLAEAGGDPLMTSEVESGLQQLLSDWTLFKKSGLFGTGPSGTEHPLYVKIKDLQIPLLLAGRFEGATQEIKQSITDYMNGWRYEQGIIYEQGETFDHYLRRVIRHILDLQK